MSGLAGRAASGWFMSAFGAETEMVMARWRRRSNRRDNVSHNGHDEDAQRGTR